MDQFLQHVVNAISLGSVYALVGIGLTLIYGIMRVVNFAHGELYTFGAYTCFLASTLLGVNFYLALVLGIALGIALGALIELVLLRPLRASTPESKMLVLIGAWIILQNVELLVWGPISKSIRSPFPAQPLSVGPVSTSWLGIFIVAVASIAILIAHLLIHKTKLGKAMRATFQDREAAALMGVNINFIHTATFAFGAGLAALACGLLGTTYVLSPQMGDLVSIKAFAIVILGGLGNLLGAALGGLLVAFAEEIGAGYISSGYRDAMAFLLIIVVLTFKPTGLFTRSERIG